MEAYMSNPIKLLPTMTYNRNGHSCFLALDHPADSPHVTTLALLGVFVD